MFSTRRLATTDELGRLVASFDVISPPAGLAEAEISEVATIPELGRLHTVVAIPDAPPGADSFYTLAECERSWASGGGSAHDQASYGRALAQAADPAFEPPLLIEPTPLTSSGWWIIDGIHRAAALLTVRTAAGRSAPGLSVFVLPRPLR
jgi:hypothetical protein